MVIACDRRTIELCLCTRCVHVVVVYDRKTPGNGGSDFVFSRSGLTVETYGFLVPHHGARASVAVNSRP